MTTSPENRPVSGEEKTGSSRPEEDVVPGNQDESEILERVFTKGTKALSGCLPYFLVGILFIVILYVLLLIFRLE